MLHGDGVVLAGGASRRMGQPKEELRLPTGETLLVHAQKTLSETVDGIIWIARAYGHYPHDPTDLPDAVPHKGPLAGIQNALTHSQKSYLAVLAVDLPNVSVSLIRAMVHTMANDDTLNVVYAASARDRQPRDRVARPEPPSSTAGPRHRGDETVRGTRQEVLRGCTHHIDVALRGMRREPGTTGGVNRGRGSCGQTHKQKPYQGREV